jgi:hypothetical protein
MWKFSEEVSVSESHENETPLEQIRNRSFPDESGNHQPFRRETRDRKPFLRKKETITKKISEHSRKMSEPWGRDLRKRKLYYSRKFTDDFLGVLILPRK